MRDALGDNEHPEIEARLRLALARVNRRLENHEIELLRDRIARTMLVARRLSAVPLGNGDEPAHDFFLAEDLVGDEVVRP